jgi:hypothetical protein
VIHLAPFSVSRKIFHEIYFFFRPKLPSATLNILFRFSFIAISQQEAYPKMLSSFRVVVVLALVLSSSMSADARRRSRMALPIEVSADAPLEDNLATASDAVVAAEKVELPSASLAKEQPKEEAIKKAAAEKEAASDSADCSADNVNFELVTG